MRPPLLTHTMPSHGRVPRRMFPLPSDDGGYFYERPMRYFEKEDVHDKRIFTLTLCLMGMCGATVLVLVAIGGFVWANQLKS